MNNSRPLRVGIVGGAWRGQYFARLSRHFPQDLECIGIVARREETRQEIADQLNVPTYSSLEDLLRAGTPDFVITSVSWSANPAILEELVSRGIPVLSETPPAPDLPTMRQLWERVGASGLVQVAEQYLQMPTHAARRTAVHRGVIGEVSSVQISSTHLYHAVSVIRGMLGVSFEQATVSARRFTGPLINPSTRAGWTRDLTPHPASTTIATLEFSSGRSALYDFTDNQSRNHLRSRRLVIRGSSGEIDGDQVVRLLDEETILHSRITRHQSGYELDHEGFDTTHLSLDGQLLWRQPFPGLRLNDEDIAMSSMMLSMTRWVRNQGPAPYPLAEAAQDFLLGLAIIQSVDTGALVTTHREAWSPE
ncbi:Gfo/Idh/MocA family protein [Psychromicrobium xiongbiense]|uniref:Gfo/Idh/MocA family protein n=1 Tax=Psychromicrobium xiongbiense TaxID=3051184 RepID=UPI002553089C|nr:Gfo/Idh/MocA family oxidoreductase [Psychromicrobium sp. YIM S02556]